MAIGNNISLKTIPLSSDQGWKEKSWQLEKKRAQAVNRGKVWLCLRIAGISIEHQLQWRKEALFVENAKALVTVWSCVRNRVVKWGFETEDWNIKRTCLVERTGYRNRGKSYPRSVFPHKNLTELSLSKLEVMVRARANEVCLAFSDVDSNDAVVHVPVVSSSFVPHEVNAVHTEYYLSQPAKGSSKDFSEHISLFIWIRHNRPPVSHRPDKLVCKPCLVGSFSVKSV